MFPKHYKMNKLYEILIVDNVMRLHLDTGNSKCTK